MNMTVFVARNVLRNKFRTLATVAGVAAAVLTFVLLRTVVTAWSTAADYAAQDRIATRHKVSFIMGLPRRYLGEIKEVQGVKEATSATWFGGKVPAKERDFFATIAVDPETFFGVYDEIRVPEEQKESWRQTKRGALVGRVLAERFNWQVGQKVKLSSTIYPGDWEFQIAGIYDSNRRSVDLGTFYFHYNYLNDGLPERMKDEIGWVVARVDGAELSARTANAIDQRFDARDIQTKSQSEKALNNSFLGMLSAMLKAIDFVSLVILAIVMLILGNTMVMGVRERTTEYGVLRALGFLPRHLVAFILGEALLIGVLGGVLGLALSYPIVEKGVGRFLEENMQGTFPYFRIALGTAIAALGCAAALGLIAAAIPALNASKSKIVDSLRTVG